MPIPQNKSGLSPMMRQYLKVKNEHPEKILFFRLGDFYEMFFDDAITASAELDLVLTGRDCGLSERAPMCGVPYHSCEGYIAKLIDKGYKVAICEQIEDPATATGIVKREIVRTITPGTVTEPSMLEEGVNNYIAGLYIDDKGFGLCFSDITTGMIELTESPTDDSTLMSELCRFSPREVVMNSIAYCNKEMLANIEKQLEVIPEQLHERFFELKSSEESLLKKFDKNDSTVKKILKSGNGVKALNALLEYIGDTHQSGIKRLIKLNIYRIEQYLSISAISRRNLELTESFRGREKRGSMLWVIDKTKSSMGRRLLRNFLEKPLTNADSINERLDAVSELYLNTVNLAQIRDLISNVSDIERIMTRVLYKSCTPRDFVALSNTTILLEQIKSIGTKFSCKLLSQTVSSIDTLRDLSLRIIDTISEDPPALLREGGYIKKGFNNELDELRELLSNNRGFLSKMENDLKEKTAIRKLKIGYNKVFGYYIEVPHSNTDIIPDFFYRKQTLTSAERYITEDLKELENKIIGASERISILERGLFEELREAIETELTRIQNSADAVSLLDVLCCFAVLGLENNYTRPIVDEGNGIDIKNGRHPVVELVSDELFIPNNTLLDDKTNLVNIITGPNMAGKSTYMRQTALIIILAQMGCYVPAREARIGVVDAIFTRIGASDDLFSGDSTFMIEMKEVAHIFKKATKKSLIILDEIGRGTSTYDGMSIARAVIERISAKDGLRAKTMFATHYHELTVMDREFNCIKNYNIAVKKRGDSIVFLRKIVYGPSDDSYGIEVANLAGVPSEVIELAKNVLKNIENNHYVHKNKVELEKETDMTDVVSSVIEKLRNIDINTLTPIEAMYFLHELNADIIKGNGE